MHKVDVTQGAKPGGLILLCKGMKTDHRRFFSVAGAAAKIAFKYGLG
jgi:hypothetical protein